MTTESQDLGLTSHPKDGAFYSIVSLYLYTLNRKNLLALTGILSTMPSEISLGYVTAMPKFTRILNAVKEKNAQ